MTGPAAPALAGRGDAHGGAPGLYCEVRPRHAAGSIEVRHGVTPTAFGDLLLAATAHGLCFAEFLDDGQRQALALLRALWPDGDLVPAARRIVSVDALVAGATQPRLHLRGTPFQLRVWQQLCGIRRGQTRSYGEMAAALGMPAAARAVAGAVAANHLALLVPCHRVVRGDGGLGGYRWGRDRKLALLRAEGAALPGGQLLGLVS
jgi:AraC family transcriptional regulator of adaptative response/methylated-DNA-[protein]-cysteine methyltransferase